MFSAIDELAFPVNFLSQSSPEHDFGRVDLDRRVFGNKWYPDLPVLITRDQVARFVVRQQS
jgi:hypothetical protein